MFDVSMNLYYKCGAVVNLTLASNCIHGSVLPQHRIRARGQQIRLEQIRNDQKQWFAKSIVLELNNWEEPKIMTYVISNNFSIPDLQMRPPVIWDGNGICQWHTPFAFWRTPPPQGGFLFTMFPDQEQCVRDFTTRCDLRISSSNLLHIALDQGT